MEYFFFPAVCTIILLLQIGGAIYQELWATIVFNDFVNFTSNECYDVSVENNHVFITMFAASVLSVEHRMIHQDKSILPSSSSTRKDVNTVQENV